MGIVLETECHTSEITLDTVVTVTNYPEEAVTNRVMFDIYLLDGRVEGITGVWKVKQLKE